MIVAALMTASFSAAAITPESSWEEVLKEAEGQTVYFNAWGGSPQINQYLRWANQSLQSEYKVTLEHVKVGDIAETVNRLLAEKTAGKHTGGSVDMVWINGENFKSMKQHALLWGPFVTMLPNWQYVDKSLPIDVDFTEPTLGLEAPWGVGQLVFIHDTERLKKPPRSFNALLDYAQENPGRISYPQPPEFHGSSFLKAALIELSGNDERLYKPVNHDEFDTISAPLWQYLDALHKVAWQKGQRFPASSAETKQLLDDGQLDLAITFNPNDANASIAAGSLTPSAHTFAFEKGALSNIHFMGIPWNAENAAGALVAINFLISPEAQIRKSDSEVWGDPAIIDTSKLTGETQGFDLFPSLPEPHPSWQVALEESWQQRYGVQ
nr:ABC transporter substrate-binding protein [Thaumasiovibrio subtropicus]